MKKMTEKIKKWRRSMYLNHADKFYQGMFLLTVLLALFFAIPTFLFGSEKDNVDTKIGVEHQLILGNVKLTQLKRGYNEKENYAEVFLKTDGDFPDGGQLQMLASESKTKQQLSFELIKLTDGYYLIQLKNIPKNWRTIVMDIGITSPNSPKLEVKSVEELFANFGSKDKRPDENTVQGALFMNHKAVEKDSNAEVQNKQKYLAEALSIQKKESKKLIHENDQLIEKSEKMVLSFKKEIDELEAQKQYQTQSEIIRTDNEIDSKKSRIGTYKEKINDAEKSNTELRQKIEKLNQQVADEGKK